jgi:hypothetical protein
VGPFQLQAERFDIFADGRESVIPDRDIDMGRVQSPVGVGDHVLDIKVGRIFPYAHVAYGDEVGAFPSGSEESDGVGCVGVYLDLAGCQNG